MPGGVARPCRAHQKEVKMECPYIDKRTPDKFNKPINYKDVGGNIDYIFYEHSDPFGKISLVQFCKHKGRKKDVFECLNESEWRNCHAFCFLTLLQMEDKVVSNLPTM